MTGFFLIHVVVCMHTSFFMDKLYYSICINHIMLIHLLIGIYLGCWHLLYIVNNVTMNISAQIFVWT